MLVSDLGFIVRVHQGGTGQVQHSDRARRSRRRLAVCDLSWVGSELVDLASQICFPSDALGQAVGMHRSTGICRSPAIS